MLNLRGADPEDLMEEEEARDVYSWFGEDDYQSEISNSLEDEEEEGEDDEDE